MSSIRTDCLFSPSADVTARSHHDVLLRSSAETSNHLFFLFLSLLYNIHIQFSIHRFVDVVQADARISLFLNNGSQSNPTAVVLLSPEILDEQLNRACQAFVDHTVKVKKQQQTSVEDCTPRKVLCVSPKLREPDEASLHRTVVGSTAVEPYARRI